MKEIEIKQPDSTSEIKRNVISRGIIAQKKLYKGHKCFKLDIIAMLKYGKTKEAIEKNEQLKNVIHKFISEVTTEKSMDLSSNTIRNKVVMETGCAYETALNLENVKKKFIQKLKR